MRLRPLLLFLGLAIGLTPPAFALRGVIDDPDGFTYVRAGESYTVPAGISYRIIDAR